MTTCILIPISKHINDWVEQVSNVAKFHVHCYQCADANFESFIELKETKHIWISPAIFFYFLCFPSRNMNTFSSKNWNENKHKTKMFPMVESVNVFFVSSYVGLVAQHLKRCFPIYMQNKHIFHKKCLNNLYSLKTCWALKSFLSTAKQCLPTDSNSLRFY